MHELKLRSCPFCGNEVVDLWYEGRGPYVREIEIHCMGCQCNFILSTNVGVLYADGKEAFVGSDAVDIWNKRAEDKEV